MDIKCPSSGMDNYNQYSNLANLIAKDEVKFVVKDLEDYVFAKEVLKKYPTKAGIIFSPVMGRDGSSSAKNLAEWITEDKIPRARLGLQIHKLIGVYSLLFLFLPYLFNNYIAKIAIL
jgi:7-carboxy-7-deazaguanine synthase